VGDHLQYSTPPEEGLILAPRIFHGNLHVIAKFTAFLCVTPSGGVDVRQAVTDGQAGSVIKAEVPSRVAKEPPSCTLNYTGTGGGEPL
jgi:hypothetical protein